MKKYLPKKLFVFLVLIPLFLNSNAQIIHTNVDPDQTYYHYSGGSYYYVYNFDLNNDSVKDYSFWAEAVGIPFFAHYASVMIDTSFSSNKVLCDTAGYPVGLDSNEVIQTSLNWNSDDWLVLRTVSDEGYTTYYNGNCNGENYLGFYIKAGGQKYLGWLRISVTASASDYSAFSSFTIKEYAYNSIPNQPILAGETSCTSPTVTIIKDGPLSFCEGDSVVLTATGSGYLYQWKKNGVDISGATSQNYTAKNAGKYSVVVTNSCGSVTSANKKVKIICREDIINDEESDITVYPNPTSNTLHIESPSILNDIQIMNLLGEVVYSDKINDETANLPVDFEIDVSNFHCGLYVIVIYTNGEKYYSQFIKQ